MAGPNLGFRPRLSLRYLRLLLFKINNPVRVFRVFRGWFRVLVLGFRVSGNFVQFVSPRFSFCVDIF